MPIYFSQTSKLILFFQFIDLELFLDDGNDQDLNDDQELENDAFTTDQEGLNSNP